MRLPPKEPEQPAQPEGTTAASSDVLYEESYHPCFLWTLILAPCFMPFVWKYHVRVTTTQLLFGYATNCGAMTVDRSQILTVEVLERIHGLCEWGGYGIRKQLPSWETGYLPKNGSGIRLTLKNSEGEEKAYTFICDEAERVASILTGDA